LRNIQAQLRRTSHIKENAPNNIAHHLNRSIGGRNHAFLSLDDGCCNLEDSYAGTDDVSAYPVMMSPIPGTMTQSYISGNWGNNIWADNHPSTGEQSHPSFAVDNTEENEPYDSGTESDTSSDSMNEPVDFTDCPNVDDPNAVSEHLFFQYRHAKRRWRRWSRKPVRRVRRYYKKTAYTKHYGRGKSQGRFVKGKYKSRRSYFTDWRNLSDRDMTEALTYLQREDPSVNVYTSGKGKGRRGNPKGPDGNPLKCFDCGSTEHLRAECPQRGKGAQVHFAGGNSNRRKGKHNFGKSNSKGNNLPTFLSFNDPDLPGGQGVNGHMQGQSHASGIQHEQFMYVDQGAQQNESRQAYLQTAEQQAYRGPLSSILADNEEDEYPEDRRQMAPPHYIVVQDDSGNHNNLHGRNYAQRESRWSPDHLLRQNVSDSHHIHPIYAGSENHHIDIINESPVVNAIRRDMINVQHAEEMLGPHAGEYNRVFGSRHQRPGFDVRNLPFAGMTRYQREFYSRLNIGSDPRIARTPPGSPAPSTKSSDSFEG